MSPLVNALVGVLFLALGIVATMLMYFLRGRIRPAVAAAEESGKAPAGASEATGDELYLGPWRRYEDEREEYLDTIHQMAETGRSIIEPMRTRKVKVTWDDLLFKGAQLAESPLNEDEPVDTQTVIGPNSAKPLVIDTPIIISHMSYGALSREVKTALARGSAAVGTAICSGEGGLLEDEWQAAHRYIFEYVPNQYSVTDENLRRVDAIEIKIGQSAKPGMGGQLPGGKVTEEIAAVRGRAVGEDIVSPARFENLQTTAELDRLVSTLRDRSEGRPIGIKIAAGNLEADIDFALAASPDFITVDGRAGATGAAVRTVKDATSVPTIHAVSRARQVLQRHQADHVSLIVTGGMRISADFAKALALGADAVAIATAALIASGCQQYRICNTGKCPVGIATQDPMLRKRLQIDTSARYLESFLRVSTNELKMFARLTGNDNVHSISASDICTTSLEVSQSMEIEHV